MNEWRLESSIGFLGWILQNMQAIQQIWNFQDRRKVWTSREKNVFASIFAFDEQYAYTDIAFSM